VEGFSFDCQHRVLMGRVEHLLMAIIGAPMTGDLDGAVQDWNQRVGSHQGQRTVDGIRRNGIIIEIEPDIDVLSRPDRFDAAGGKSFASSRCLDCAIRPTHCWFVNCREHFHSLSWQKA